MTEIETLQSTLTELKTELPSLKEMRTESAKTKQELKSLQSLVLATYSKRKRGVVSERCALHLASQFITHCERSGKLEGLCSAPGQRDSLLTIARDVLGTVSKTALTTSDIPPPSQYSGEIRELISEFGIVRRQMSPYPIGMGTSRPARMGNRPAFGSVAMSAAFAERSPTLTFASLESHKIGGIVRLPREIDEQSVVPMGQFLARYGAIEFARAEDTWGFLADGTSTYESVRGIVQIARDNANTVVLGSTKTKPSDA